MNKPVFLSSLQSIFKRKKNYTLKEIVPWIQKASLGVSKKIRNDYVDMDYIKKLNTEERKFLKNFNREFYNADFQHSGTVLHNNKEKELDCYNRNNSRNRCVYALLKCRNRLYTFGLDIPETSFTFEDDLIEYLDYNNF